MEACFSLIAQPSWQAYGAAVAAQEPLLQEIVRQFLSCVGVLAVALALPPAARPAGCTWRTATYTVSLLLRSPMLYAVLEDHLHAADSSSRATHLASLAQLAQLLPPDQPLPQRSQDAELDLVTTLLALLGVLCKVCSDAPASAQQLNSQQVQRVTPPLLGVLSRLPRLLPLAHGSSRQTAVLRSACHYLVVLCDNWGRSAGGSSRPPDRSDSQQQVVVLPGSWADTAAWCCAAAAVVQCMATAQQLHELCGQDSVPAGFAFAATAFTNVALSRVQSALALSTTPPAKVHATVWQLHSRLSQLVHVSAAASRPLISLRDERQAGHVLLLSSDCLQLATKLRYTGLEPLPSNHAQVHK